MPSPSGEFVKLVNSVLKELFASLFSFLSFRPQNSQCASYLLTHVGFHVGICGFSCWNLRVYSSHTPKPNYLLKIVCSWHAICMYLDGLMWILTHSPVGPMTWGSLLSSFKTLFSITAEKEVYPLFFVSKLATCFLATNHSLFQEEEVRPYKTQ